ncbi:MAG: methylenetetrahydrofolate reductase [Candidatus Altiarchaeota archaeon]|nr:methylenetetrahydrofolate reductase [Candidatus Altiarchaeota archaeon]
MNFREKLLAGQFVVTGEIAPKKGVDISGIIEAIKHLRGVDAVNVTDNQRACVRLSSLAASKILLDNGVEPIYQLTCRDRNRIALQSDLLGAWILGIKNVLVISGDHPSLGDHPYAKPVYDLDSVQLISTIKGLNQGQDLEGNKLNQPADYLIGAAANPGADDLDAEILKVEKKILSGAVFLQTQAVYDVELFKTFMEKVKPLGIPVLAGIVPLKSAKMASFMNENIPGIHVPKHLIQELSDSDNPTQAGIVQAAKIIKDVKKHCNGIHLMSLGWEDKVQEILQKAGLRQ